MKYYIFFVSVLLAFCTSNKMFRITSRQSDLLPYELQDYIKSYPEYELQHQAYQEALDQVKASLHGSGGRTSSWTMEGPTNIGGRITSIAVSPVDTNTFYVGTPNNGIFKTTDGGANFIPVFDLQSNLSIGCLSIHPTQPGTIYAGTGDPVVSGYPYLGNGIYKSTDAGLTWQNIGLSETKVINKIAIDPVNPDIVYAATMGLSMQRTPDRGLYKSIDGGKNWQKVFYVNDETGCSQVLIDPSNTKVLYVATWNRIRSQFESLVAGVTSRLHKSTDGGKTWTMLTNGLPNKRLAKWGLTMSKSNPNKLYAIPVDSTLNHEGVYVSTDGGDKFTKLTSTLNKNAYGGFGWYFGKIAVNPANDDELLVCGVNLYKSSDGGTTFALSGPNWNTYELHADKHDIQYLSDHSFLIATDGGLYKTVDNGNKFQHFENLPLTQFYRVARNPNQPDLYFGGAQDNGTSGGNTAISSDWPRLYGGDGFQPIFDPLDSTNAIFLTQNGGIGVVSKAGGVNGEVGINPSDRVNWDLPIHLNEKNPKLMYLGTYRVYKNAQGFVPKWDSVSTDLTDGILTAAAFHNISAIHSSSIDENIVYAGTSDANAWVSIDGAKSWQNITGNLPNHYVSAIKASPNNKNTVFVTHTGYKLNNFIPHIHRSDDNGQSWTDISGDLPQASINDVFVWPGNDKVIFVATDFGVYSTNSAGVKWNRVGNNMPIIKCTDIEYNPSVNRLFVGTYARSMMSIDVSDIVSVNLELKTESLVRIFPTLLQDFQFQISCEKWLGKSEVQIFDLSGKMTQQQVIVLESGNNVISMAQVPVGVYLVRIAQGRKILQVQKIVITKT